MSAAIRFPSTPCIRPTDSPSEATGSHPSAEPPRAGNRRTPPPASRRIEQVVLRERLHRGIALRHVAFGHRMARIDLAHVDPGVVPDRPLGKKVERVQPERVGLEPENRRCAGATRWACCAAPPQTRRARLCRPGGFRRGLPTSPRRLSPRPRPAVRSATSRSRAKASSPAPKAGPPAVRFAVPRRRVGTHRPRSARLRPTRRRLRRARRNERAWSCR